MIEAMSAATQLQSVNWRVGHTGQLTPIGNVRGVEICGVTVTSASLANAGEIKRLWIRIGDTVEVARLELRAIWGSEVSAVSEEPDAVEGAADPHGADHRDDLPVPTGHLRNHALSARRPYQRAGLPVSAFCRERGIAASSLLN